MSQSQEFQEQQEAGVAENNREGKLLLLFVCGIFSIPFLLFIPLFFAEDKQTSCEEAGGTYQAVGEQFSFAVKSYVDVFECEK